MTSMTPEERTELRRQYAIAVRQRNQARLALEDATKTLLDIIHGMKGMGK